MQIGNGTNWTLPDSRGEVPAGSSQEECAHRQLHVLLEPFAAGTYEPGGKCRDEEENFPEHRQEVTQRGLAEVLAHLLYAPMRRPAETAPGE
jgi:hypothetical protein